MSRRSSGWYARQGSTRMPSPKGGGIALRDWRGRKRRQGDVVRPAGLEPATPGLEVFGGEATRGRRSPLRPQL